MAPTTVLVCLDTLGLTVDSLKDCEDLTAELRAVRRAYLQKVLKVFLEHTHRYLFVHVFSPCHHLVVTHIDAYVSGRRATTRCEGIGVGVGATCVAQRASRLT